MARKLSNWLQSFEDWFCGTEIPALYAKAVGISVLASAMEKRIWVLVGRYKIYSNLYCVLVGKPGIGKNQAINFGYKLLTLALPDIKISSDSVSTRAFYSDLEEAQNVYTFKGQNFTHSSLTVISHEFEIFIGDKKNNNQLLINLTNFFDSPENIFKHKTQHSGSNNIENLWLNLLGATTPTSLANCLPISAIGGGFTSRILFVVAENKRQHIAISRLTPEQQRVESLLIHDLFFINKIIAEYTLSTESEQNFTAYYATINTNKICTDSRFEGWYARKALFMHKLAMIFSLTETDSNIIQWRYYEQAINYLAEIESKMHLAFKGLGSTPMVADINLILDFIKARKSVTVNEIIASNWNISDTTKLNEMLDIMYKAGAIKMDMSGSSQKFKFVKEI